MKIKYLIITTLLFLQTSIIQAPLGGKILTKLTNAKTAFHKNIVKPIQGRARNAINAIKNTVTRKKGYSLIENKSETTSAKSQTKPPPRPTERAFTTNDLAIQYNKQNYLKINDSISAIEKSDTSSKFTELETLKNNLDIFMNKTLRLYIKDGLKITNENSKIKNKKQTEPTTETIESIKTFITHQINQYKQNHSNDGPNGSKIIEELKIKSPNLTAEELLFIKNTTHNLMKSSKLINTAMAKLTSPVRPKLPLLVLEHLKPIPATPPVIPPRPTTTAPVRPANRPTVRQNQINPADPNSPLYSLRETTYI